jgi:hypothetical protein
MHRPYPVDARPGQAATQSAAMRQLLSAYVQEMNVPVRIVDDMLMIPPDSNKLISPTALFSYGIRDVDPVVDQENNVEKAKQLGITVGSTFQGRRRAGPDAPSRTQIHFLPRRCCGLAAAT